jgi:beta-glucuronidase
MDFRAFTCGLLSKIDPGINYNLFIMLARKLTKRPIRMSALILVQLIGATGLVFAKASKVSTSNTPQGWQLFVDGQPFLIRGMCYYPVTIGESPEDANFRDWMMLDDDHDGRNDVAYQSWVDANKNDRQDPNEKPVGDFKLMQDMGVNVIRVYHHASSNPEVQAIYKDNPEGQLVYNHPPNKTLLMDLYKTFGIRVAMGDYLGAYATGSGADWNTGTDYRDPQQLAHMMVSVEDMVREFKDEPYILMWVIGNENNYDFNHTNAGQYPEAYAKFVNRVAHRIHELDPNHPVVLCNGDTQLLKTYAVYTPDIDIFGTNSYRDPAYGTLWKEVAETLNKPVVLTEYGVAQPRFGIEDTLDEDYQASQHKHLWCEIENHSAGHELPQNSLGGFIFEWVDNWWQAGGPNHHDHGIAPYENEWMGICSQGSGDHSPLERQLRKSYFMYRALWKTHQDHCPSD